MGEQVKMTALVVGAKAKDRFNIVIDQACAEVPRDCTSGEVQPRSIRSKLLCGHIPTCDEINPVAGEGFERANSAEWLWT